MIPRGRSGALLRPTLRAAVLVGGLLGNGCGGGDRPSGESPDLPTAQEWVDDGGRLLSLNTPPRRIVSLIPAATQIVIALGEGGRLAGRSDHDPEGEGLQLPSVGGGLHPSQESLLALSPDLVLRFEGESDRQTPTLLDAAGIPHFGIRLDTIGDVRRMTTHLAQITASEEIGERLLARMDRDLHWVQSQVSTLPAIRVAFLLDGDPPWVVGGNTFLHELVEVAGGINVFADLGAPYRPVSVEEILRRSPQRLLMIEGTRIPSGLSHVPVSRLPPEVQLPGHRMAISALEIARLLFPDRGW